MKILLLSHSFNGLTQRFWVELERLGHEISLELDIHHSVTEQAIELFAPDLLVAPLLKRKLPAAIYQKLPCLIVHPGPLGDAGPSALDWAIAKGVSAWGVTLLQAVESLDAGPVWAHQPCRLTFEAKCHLYRNPVTEAAVIALQQAVSRIVDGAFIPKVVPAVKHNWRPAMDQSMRHIDWQRDQTADILTKIHAADSHPGVLDQLCGREVYLYGAYGEPRIKGEPKQLLGWRGDAICVGTVDSAVWIRALRPKTSDPRDSFKLPASEFLQSEIADLPELSLPLSDPQQYGYRELWLEQRGDVACLHFEFLNGALSTHQCWRLLEATREAKASGCKVLILAGGRDFWCNGIQLNVIEAAAHPADESWANINALNDWVLELIQSDELLLVAAMQGNSAAGGCFAALACDQIWARSSVIFNPHYRNMGNLYGSEYWTYLLPKRCSREAQQFLRTLRLPIDAKMAESLGLVDEVLPGDHSIFMTMIWHKAQQLLQGWSDHIADKRQQRLKDESTRALADYRAAELARMKLNFYGCDPSFHVARYDFVRKVPHSHTPLYLARHRRRVRR